MIDGVLHVNVDKLTDASEMIGGYPYYRPGCLHTITLHSTPAGTVATSTSWNVTTEALTSFLAEMAPICGTLAALKDAFSWLDRQAC